MFRQFIFFLINKIHGVYLVDDLRYPWNKREKLTGLLANNCIYLDSKLNRKETLITFIHELAHAICNNIEEEKEILKVEKILFGSFTREQKEILEICIANAEKKEIFY